MIVNNILQCSVKSIEDHGIILDTGKQEYSGFISNKELTNAQIDVNTIVPGLVILCSIASKPSGRTINLKPTTATISAKENHSFNNFINRFYTTRVIVDALINDVTENGLVTKVYGLVDGTIALSQIQNFELKRIKT